VTIDGVPTFIVFQKGNLIKSLLENDKYDKVKRLIDKYDKKQEPQVRPKYIFK
jgi:hypothetical protein